MENQLQIFNNPEFGTIRTLGNWENPLFCLADVSNQHGRTHKKFSTWNGKNYDAASQRRWTSSCWFI